MISSKKIDNGKIALYTPYNRTFVKRIKKIGSARWNGTAWVIPEESIETARDIMRDIYGETDQQTQEYVSLKITVMESQEEICDPVTAFGKTLAYAFGRDSGAKVGEDVELISGCIYSGGSIRNWSTNVAADSIFILRKVPKSFYESENYDWLTVELLPETESDKLAILRDEKRKLLIRLSEINKQLGESD